VVVGGGAWGAWDKHVGDSGGAWERFDGYKEVIWTWAEISAADLSDGVAVEVVWRIVAGRG
jgi:hypothetical protein